MPVPSDIDWPEDVLGCPLRQSYSEEVNPLFYTIEVEDGPDRYRLVATETRRDHRMVFSFTPEQFEAFEIFYYDDLKDGSRWFNMRVLTGDGMVPCLCHFSDARNFRRNPSTAERYEIEVVVETYLTGYVPPPPFTMDDPVDAKTADDPAVDIYDGRDVGDPRPGDVVNSLTPEFI